MRHSRTPTAIFPTGSSWRIRRTASCASRGGACRTERPSGIFPRTRRYRAVGCASFSPRARIRPRRAKATRRSRSARGRRCISSRRAGRSPTAPRAILSCPPTMCCGAKTAASSPKVSGRRRDTRTPPRGTRRSARAAKRKARSCSMRRRSITTRSLSRASITTG